MSASHAEHVDDALGELLTETETARRLGIDKERQSILATWRYRGGGPPFVRLGEGKDGEAAGRVIRYPAALLEKWLRDRLNLDSPHRESKARGKPRPARKKAEGTPPADELAANRGAK